MAPDRRQRADRREEPRVPKTGRRREDHPHGTRGRYQAGCICTPCRAAESAYRSALRREHAKGQTPKGAKVDASAMWKQIKSLRIEGFTYTEIARRLGLPQHRLRLHPDRVTQEHFERVRKLYRFLMLEQPDPAITPPVAR